MKIKKIALFMLLIAGNAAASGQVTNLTLNKVTLFLQGAELQSQAMVAVEKGQNKVLLTGLANEISNSNDIKVAFADIPDAKISLQSIDMESLPEDSQNNSKLKTLQDKLKQLEAEYQATEIQFAAVSEIITLLQNNRIDSLVKSSPNLLMDMKNTLEFVKTNLTASLTEQAALQTKLQDLNQQVEACRAQVDHESAMAKPSTHAVVLGIDSDKAVTLPISISYVIQNAAWRPTYEIHVADINSPLQLIYKAGIYQDSGLDWDNLDLTLSTANPSVGITPPTLLPWRIDLHAKNSNPRLMDKRAPAVEPTAEDDESTTTHLAQPTADYLANNFVENVDNPTGIDLQFTLKLPHTIKNDSDNDMLILQKKALKADYRYVAIPKLDQAVFLQAQLSDWNKLNLLRGDATIFYANNYVGVTTIDPSKITDKLDIALGRDKGIVIARNRDLNETSAPSLLGSKISQKYSYSIDVKNNKTLPITVVVYDELPVIQNQVVVMDDTKYDGASYDKESGLLEWALPLQAEEAKNVHFSFKLTYPKDKASLITGL
ncbi:mucoidy inhibitor MuiA family protein [Orbaceae bacterium ESL0727]|nr:mucoidy inhibitor MuiA family protein [Orbaceae bacterium ESL0727]